MSSTRFSQRIVVLDHGQLVQDGTHASLMAKSGIYRDLFNAQAQYYTEDRIKAARKKWPHPLHRWQINKNVLG